MLDSILELMQSVLPVAATDAAHSWDILYWFLFVVTAFFFVLVMAPMVWFMWRYRKGAGTKPEYIEHNAILEVVWTAVPTIILMVIFAWGFIVYKELQYGAPKDALEIRVVATGSWQWKFQYPDGRITQDELFVPLNMPVKLTITADPGTPGVAGSSSMIHSFFVPNFRIKKDAVPGLYNDAWFQANKLGQHIFFCTEYCGSQHSIMYGRVVVLNEDQWQRWQWGKLDVAEVNAIPWVGYGAQAEKYRDQPTKEAALEKFENSNQLAVNYKMPEGHADLVKQGYNLTRTMGCTACHASDGAPAVGPGYKGLYQSNRMLSNGYVVKADEEYIRESIVNPMAKVVKGYENVVMPPYPGQLSELEMNALIAYIKSVQ